MCQRTQRVPGESRNGCCLRTLPAHIAQHDSPGRRVQGEDVEEVAADLAAVAGRPVAAGHLGHRDLRQLTGNHAGLQCYHDPRLLFEQVLESLLGVDPLGEVSQHHQFARGPASPVGQWLAQEVEGSPVGAFTQRQLICGIGFLAWRSLRDRRSRAGEQLVQRQADESGPRRAEHQGRGRVDVHNPTESVQDEHGVFHVVDDEAAGQGSEVDQALAVETPDQHATGDDECGGRQVDAREPADLEVVEQVGRPREERRGDQYDRHLPVGAGKPHHARHEKSRGPQKDDVGVDKVHPERRVPCPRPATLRPERCPGRSGRGGAYLRSRAGRAAQLVRSRGTRPGGRSRVGRGRCTEARRPATQAPTRTRRRTWHLPSDP